MLFLIFGSLIFISIVVFTAVILALKAKQAATSVPPTKQPATQPQPSTQPQPAPPEPQPTTETIGGREVTILPSVGQGLGQGGGNTDTFVCDGNSGDYIKRYTFSSSDVVNSLQFQCNSLKNSPVYGTPNGTIKATFLGPLSKLSGTAYTKIDNIVGYGGKKGIFWTRKCPDGESIVGMNITSGESVGKLSPICAKIQ